MTEQVVFQTIYRRNRALEKAQELIKAEEVAKLQQEAPRKRGRPKRKEKKWFVLIVVIPTLMGIRVFASLAGSLLMYSLQLWQKSHSKLWKSL